ncbi:MAG: alpha/beta hydrolase [Chloroflexi bacterium]|nr:alpha/beta hydrolase [Chloroflexota bacterium]
MTRLYLRESGSTDAPLIVFLHGAGLSGRMWQPQFERLAEYHCLAPDLPEHGQSADICPFDLLDASQQVAELIRQRGPNGRAHLVGLSLGGALVLTVLRIAPEVVDHAIVSGTSARLGKMLVAIQGLNEPVLRLLNPDQLAALMAWQFHIPPQHRDMLRQDMRRFTPQAFHRVNQAYTEIELPQASGAPPLVLVGQKETFVAKRMARKLCASIPGAKGMMVRGVGHVWNLEAPDLFADTVRAWITDQPLPSELLPL